MVIKNEGIHEGQTRKFDEKNNPLSKTETGESVVEYSGLAYEANGRSPLHYHNDETEVYYITPGMAYVDLDEVRQPLTAGQFIQINPGQKHQVFNASESETLTLVVSCMPSWNANDFYLVTASISSPELGR